MSTPTRPPQEAPPHEVQSGASASIADWRQRFPAPVSHDGHEVPDVNALFAERMTVGQRAEEENRAILHHLEAQDELMIALLRSLTALEGKILETVDPLTHRQDALQQALRDDDHSTL